MSDFWLYQGDCVEVLRQWPENSVDAVVCDPPYGLEFMGKEWDAPWRSRGEAPASAKFSKGGFKESNGYARRDTPSYGKAWSNKRCQKCGHIASGGSPCRCPDPEWVIERGDVAAPMRAFQAWCEAWAREALRVLKPGGHLLAFGGSRTYHRIACAIEDAGFEVRDSLMWIYGSGFPKSKNVALSIDKGEGHPNRGRAIPTASTHLPGGKYAEEKLTSNPVEAYTAKSPEAKAWEGWGTALKPAHEPIILARKPLDGTVAANVQKWGTGALNIDGCRVEYQSEADKASATPQGACTAKSGALAGGIQNDNARSEFTRPELKGRWPANVMLDEEAAAMLDVQSGFSSTKHIEKPSVCDEAANTWGGTFQRNRGARGHTDSGGASRFFYVAKTSRRERDHGLDDFPTRSAGEATDREDGTAGLNSPRAGAGRTGGAKNTHPTVKPVSLMRELVRLVTPPGGIVLDPFVGSGTTGMAAQLEGFRFIGVDLSAEYLTIAHARISAAPSLK